MLYPEMPEVARSLLVSQNNSDLADFVEGMDLNEQWGEDNVDFEDLQTKGVEFSQA